MKESSRVIGVCYCVSVCVGVYGDHRHLFKILGTTFDG